MIQSVFNLDHFVNRDSEIRFIQEQCLESLRANKPIHPQFIEYNGVWGIGKTTLLRRIEHHCNTENLHAIWIDASDSPDQVFHNIADQVRNRYGISFPSTGDAFDESFAAMQALQKKYGAAVIFIDSLDAVAEEHLKHIEEMLHRFIEISKLLFIMASRKRIGFENIVSIKRKLTFRSLESLSHDDCVLYTKKIAQEFKEEEIYQIFLLTRGYPMAVDIVVKTIKEEQLDATTEQDQKRLMQIINEQVIEPSILPSVRHDLDRNLLGLLAIPRRFNLTLMQAIIEEFAKQHKRASNLAYMTFLRDINPDADLLYWRESRTGFSMASPIRHLLLVKAKIENLERYKQIHEFLMEENWRLAMKTSGTDRVHYIQEYLYHNASCLDNDKLQDNIDKAMNQILAETIDLLLQFKEEYEKDKELQEALGIYKDKVLEKIDKYFADSYWDLALTASDKRERISHLRSYLFYSIKDPIVADRPPFFQQCIHRVKEQFPVDIYRSLIETVLQDMEIKDLLGNDPQTWNLE